MQNRLRRLLPAMVVLNLVHVGITLPSSPLRVGQAEIYQQWADAVLLIHGITAIVATGLTLMLYRRWLSALQIGWAGALLYQLHGAGIAGADQLNTQTIMPYVGYILVNSLVVIMTLRQALISSVISSIAVAMALSVMSMQTEFPVAIGVLTAAWSVVVPALFIVAFINRTREENFYYEETISRQADELSVLNQDLTAQVDRQVADLVARSAEVESLNEELRSQVNDRSRELAVALQRLAQHEPLKPRALEGLTLGERFVLGKELGSGGMGRVYAGTDLHHQRDVAVKVLNGLGSPGAMQRFLREVESATMLRHPAIVRMLHVDITPDGRLFQVQERVHGRTLAGWLAQVRHFDAPAAIQVLHHLCDALAAAHAAGVIHRDVKPSNVMLVDSSPGLKLLDFGIAKLALDTHPGNATQTGHFLGTPAYVAPELWSGNARANMASDLYALGVTLHQVLTGDLPRIGQWDDLNRRPDLPSILISTVQALLSATPEKRPTATAVLAMTASLANDQPGLHELIRGGAVGPLRATGPLPPTHLSFS